MAGKPLVSIVLVAYKQECFIREAVQSALAQTYEPLEIILSDDCSPDRTFEIMKEEAEVYGGPHKVILNRNQKNLGLVAHFNRACELNSGEFIVAQAGDDVSLPHRAALLTKAWKEPSQVDLVCSACSVIDSSGHQIQELLPAWVPSKTLDEFASTWNCGVFGCAAGYSRRLFDVYGPLDVSLRQEDAVLPFRALLGDGIRVVDQPLVKYRKHGDNICYGRVRVPGRTESKRETAAMLPILREWIKAWDRSGRVDGYIRRRLVTMARLREYELACYDSDRLGAVRIALKGLTGGLSLRHTAGLIKRHVLRA